MCSHASALPTYYPPRIVVSELIRRRYPIKELAHPPPADPHGQMDEVLLRGGILKRTRVNRLVARISVQLLDHLTCLLIAAPHVTWCRVCFPNSVVECGEVGVERLDRRAVRPGLQEFGVRGEARRRVHAPEVCRVDYRLLLNALHVIEGVGDRVARYRHDHSLGVGDVPALSPDSRYLVARPLPEIREPAPDIASAKHCDLHYYTPSLLQSFL